MCDCPFVDFEIAAAVSWGTILLARAMRFKDFPQVVEEIESILALLSFLPRPLPLSLIQSTFVVPEVVMRVCEGSNLCVSGFYFPPARRTLSQAWSTTRHLCAVSSMERCPGFFVNRRIVQVEPHSCCRSGECVSGLRVSKLCSCITFKQGRR